MRLKQSDQLTPEDRMITLIPEKRQLVVSDLNADEAATMLKQLPWAQCIICPTRIFFRD